MKLLYLEDVEGQAEIVATFLELVGGMHSMVWAETLAEAKLKLATTSFDAVLLDLEVSDGAGVELVTLIRETAPETPIVVLTSSESSGLGIACLQAGAQDFLSKRDVTPEKLEKSLTYAVTRNKSEAPPDPDRTLSRIRALHSGSFGELSEKVVNKYREVLSTPKLLFTVQHWSLSKALASEGAESEQVLALHSHCLSELCTDLPESKKNDLLATSDLVALATVAFLADSYRENALLVRKG